MKSRYWTEHCPCNYSLWRIDWAALTLVQPDQKVRHQIPPGMISSNNKRQPLTFFTFLTERIRFDNAYASAECTISSYFNAPYSACNFNSSQSNTDNLSYNFSIPEAIDAISSTLYENSAPEPYNYKSRPEIPTYFHWSVPLLYRVCVNLVISSEVQPCQSLFFAVNVLFTLKIYAQLVAGIPVAIV